MPKMFLRLLDIFALLVTCGLFLRAEDSGTKIERIAQLKKVIAAKCSTKYTSDCLLLDLCKIIDNFSSAKYQILPGIYMVTNKSENTPVDIFELAVASNNQSEQLDTYVRKKLKAYLDSLSITWQIMDRKSAFSVRQLSDDLITELLPASNLGDESEEIQKRISPRVNSELLNV